MYFTQGRLLYDFRMVKIQKDGKGQPFIQWRQAAQGWKRAWIQIRDDDGDWAGTKRYLNIARTEDADSGPRGNSTDFPIFSSLPDEQILEAFVAAVCAVTGCELP